MIDLPVDSRSLGDLMWDLIIAVGTPASFFFYISTGTQHPLGGRHLSGDGGRAFQQVLASRCYRRLTSPLEAIFVILPVPPT